MCKNKVTAFILTALILLIALVPLFALKGAEFGGSDGDYRLQFWLSRRQEEIQRG